MAIVSQAPVNFAAQLVSSGATTAQTFQVSAAGVTAGLAAGNFAVALPASGLFNGVPFKIRAQGYINAHGTSQTVAVGLAGGTAVASLTALKASPGASGALTAGTIYPWYVEAVLFGDNVSGVIDGTVTSVIGGTANAAAIVVEVTSVNFGTASLAEPLTGIVAAQPSVAAYFAPQITWSVADTTSAANITYFVIDAA